jgi:peptidoglycan/xylan/chitin deacetylase (PgdA/CDA1 family)
MKKMYPFLISIELVLLAVLLFGGRKACGDKELVDETLHSVESDKVEGVQAENGTESGAELKKVALTFDDGPNECYTEELLDGLAVRGVKATFFLIGKKVEQNPEIVKRIYEEGHLLGNHSYDHVNLSEMSEKDACEQINKTNDAIKQITGTAPEYLRPPFGSYKKNLDAEMDMIEVLWDVDPRDWSIKNTGKVVNRVVTKVEDNDIILLHDEYATSIAAAMEIIDILQGQGYEFVTVDELLLE